VAQSTPEATLPADPQAAPEAPQSAAEGASQPVPQAPAEQLAKKLQQVRLGSTIDMPFENLGKDQGGVMLKVGDLALGCLVNDWKNDKVQTTLPIVGLIGPKTAELVVVMADGKIAASIPVELLPAESREAELNSK
jgi:hypothetical protein